MVCGADGLWTLPPYKVNCVPIQCEGPPLLPEDSYISVGHSLATYDNTVRLKLVTFLNS